MPAWVACLLSTGDVQGSECGRMLGVLSVCTVESLFEKGFPVPGDRVVHVCVEHIGSTQFPEERSAVGGLALLKLVWCLFACAVVLSKNIQHPMLSTDPLLGAYVLLLGSHVVCSTCYVGASMFCVCWPASCWFRSSFTMVCGGRPVYALAAVLRMLCGSCCCSVLMRSTGKRTECRSVLEHCFIGRAGLVALSVSGYSISKCMFGCRTHQRLQGHITSGPGRICVRVPCIH